LCFQNKIDWNGSAPGNVRGPSSSTTTDLACWNNTTGTVLKDCGGTTIPSNYNFSGAIEMLGNFINFTAQPLPNSQDTGTSYAAWRTQGGGDANGAYVFQNGTSGQIFPVGTLWAGLINNESTNGGTVIGSAGAAHIWDYPSGGIWIGASPSDPGTNNLRVQGTVTATLTSAGPGDYVCYNTSTGLFTYEATASTCTVSAARFKNLEREITPDEGWNVMVNAIGYEYTYKDPKQYGAGEHFGFTADQMATVDSDLVVFQQDGQTHAVKYGEMLPFVAAAFKKLKADNDELRAELKRLERRLDHADK
jgi:hypothetical protein